MLTNGILENNRKTTKRERFNRMLDQYYMKQRKKSVARNKFNKEDFKDKNLNYEKVKVVNLNQNIERDDFSNDISLSKNILFFLFLEYLFQKDITLNSSSIIVIYATLFMVLFIMTNSQSLINLQDIIKFTRNDFISIRPSR